MRDEESGGVQSRAALRAFLRIRQVISRGSRRRADAELLRLSLLPSLLRAASTALRCSSRQQFARAPARVIRMSIQHAARGIVLTLR